MNDPKTNVEGLLAYVRQLEADNGAQAALLAKLGHDVRSGMNGVVGMLALLLDSELADKQRRFAALAYSSGKILLSSLNDFLDFPKLQAGELELEAADFAPRGLLDEVVAAFSPQADAKGVKLSGVVDPDVPADGRGDPGRLRQILFALVGTMLKSAQGGELAVRVSVASEGGIRFSARGAGAPPPPGSAAADTSLAVAKLLAELMGGQAGIVGDPGRDAELWFTACLDKPRAAAAPPPPPSTPAAATERRLLLCEDNSANQLVALCVLEAMGVRVDTANDGVEAMRLLEARFYDLVLLDVQMPVMDGVELVRRIRDPGSRILDHSVPVLGLTACALQGDRERFIAAGMDDVETKPFDLDALAEKVRRMMRAK